MTRGDSSRFPELRLAGCGPTEWLESAYRQRDGGLAELNTDRLLDSLHSDRRFETLKAKINLP